MSIQLALFIVAVLAFVAAVACAGLAVYVYRTQDIPGVRADLAGDLRQIASGKSKSRKFGKDKKAAGREDDANGDAAGLPAQADDSLTVFGAEEVKDGDAALQAPDDSFTVARPSAKSDDSRTKVADSQHAQPAADESQDGGPIGFRVTHKQVDVHSNDDISAHGQRQES